MAELKSVERVQTRLHLERSPLNVMYGVVELHEIGLGDLVERVMLHAFKGTLPFGQASLEGNLRFPSGYQRTHVR